MVRIHLSRLLGEKRITQMELSRLTGIRPSTINDWYHEVTDRINLEHLDRICEALGCRTEDIIEYIPNPISKTGSHLIVEQKKPKGK